MTARLGLVETFLLLCMALVLALFVMWIVGPIVAEISGHVLESGEGYAIPEVPSRLADLPMTNHAEKDHAGERFNARTIPNVMQGGGCNDMTVVYCFWDESFHYICGIGPGKYIGLVVGMRYPTNPQIVTGYMASEKYWKKNIVNCVPVTLPSGMGMP